MRVVGSCQAKEHLAENVTVREFVVKIQVLLDRQIHYACRGFPLECPFSPDREEFRKVISMKCPMAERGRHPNMEAIGPTRVYVPCMTRRQPSQSAKNYRRKHVRKTACSRTKDQHTAITTSPHRPRKFASS